MRYGIAVGNIAAISPVLMKCPTDVKRKKSDRPTLARVLAEIRKRLNRSTKVRIRNGTTSNRRRNSSCILLDFGVLGSVAGLRRYDLGGFYEAASLRSSFDAVSPAVWPCDNALAWPRSCSERRSADYGHKRTPVLSVD